MKKKLVSGIFSLLLSTSMLITPLSMKASAAVPNLALHKTASSSANETSSLTPNLAFDGDTTSRSSRWSSGGFSTPQWISVDLGQIQTFDRVRIYWENSHAVDYRIDVSNDNSQWTTVKTVAGDKTGGIEVYQFTLQNARYVRMYATKNDPTIWGSISLYEMEVYNGETPLSLQEIANQQQISITLTKGQTTLPIPTAPQGYEYVLAGSENQQIITTNGQIQEPLVDTNVTLSYQLKDSATGQVAKMPDTIITVPGTYQNQTSTNLVPTVIPSLREWHGDVGQTQISSNSRIVIDPANEADLNSLGDLLKTDVKAITGKELNVVAGTPNQGDIFLTYRGGVSRLGDEGYVFDVNNYITIKATTKTGAFYGTRTLLQILMQDSEKSNVPKGTAMDYPKYKFRGLSLDVGRKFFPMSFLKEYVKYMSFYKMNTFQIHLNDNGFRSIDKLDSNGVAVTPKETITLPWESTYSAFRLESNIPGLTSTDGSYSKNEFIDFQKEATSFGVNIIPEIDSPAHSLAFVKARPDLAYGNSKDHLDISNPDTYTFIDSVFKEYLDGPNPVFVGKNVHIGSDEYSGTNINEKFRTYIDHYLNLIKGYGKTPQAWAGLSAYPGNTPISKEGTVMQVWNTGYSDPVKALKDGYQIININDGDTYIVPAAGYYYDYLNNQNLYNNWEPYKFGGTNAGNGNPNILGGMFAVWNDKVNNGISMFDIFDRLKTSTQVIAEKTWYGKNVNQTYTQFTNLLNKVKEGPDSNLLRNIRSTGDVVLNYNSKVEGNTLLDSSPNIYNGQLTAGVRNYNNRIEFTDKNQFVNTNVKSIGYPWTVSFDINPDAGNADDTSIFSGEDGIFKLRQKDTGKLGFSRENYNFKFDYVVPTDKWTDLTIVGTNQDTKLYVNGVLNQTLQRVGSNSSFDNNSEVDPNKNGPDFKRITMSTFVMPLEKIGGFVGGLGKVKVFNRALSSSEIANEAGLTTQNDLALGKTVTASSVEVPSLAAANAVDGNSSTRWASLYTNNEWLKVDLGANKTFDSVLINWETARASSYKIQVSNDDITWTDVIQKSNSPVGEERLTFAPVTGRYVKMQGITRASSYGYSIFDFSVFEFKDLTPATLTLGEVNRTSDTEATVKFTSNQGGQFYYDIVDAGEAAPAINTFGSGTVINAGETTLTNPVGLTAGAKDIYIVVKNEAKTLSNPLKITIENKVPVNPVTGIAVDKPAVTLQVGQTTELNAIIQPANATNKNVSWTSNEATVASVAVVDGHAVVSGLKEGSAIIRVTTEDGALFAETQVTVSKPIVVGPTASLSGESSIPAGSDFTVKYALHNVQNTYAQDIIFTFDPNLVEFKSVESLVDGLYINKTEKPGQIRIIMASMAADAANATGDLLSLHWKAKSIAQSQSATISLTNVKLANGSGVETQLAGDSHSLLIGVADKSALSDLIHTAQTKHDAANEGTLPGQYAPGAKAALQAAITAANTVLIDTTATQSDIGQAITVLNTAVQNFEAKRIKAKPSDINQDGKISIGDLAIVAAAYGKTPSDEGWNPNADIVKDNIIDIEDLATLARKILE